MLQPTKPELDERVTEGAGLVYLEIAKEQEEFLTLPAYFNPSTGAVITEWQLSPEDIANIAASGRLRLVIWTGGRPLQPLYPTTRMDVEALQEVGAL